MKFEEYWQAIVEAFQWEQVSAQQYHRGDGAKGKSTMQLHDFYFSVFRL